MRELKPDPARLRTLELKLSTLRSQQQGLYRQQFDLQQEIATARVNLARMEQHQTEWLRSTGAIPMAGIVTTEQARAVAAQMAAPGQGSAVDDLKQQIAQLEQELAASQAALRELSARVAPLGTLVLACQRALGRQPQPAMPVLAGVAPAEDGAAGGPSFQQPAAGGAGSASASTLQPTEAVPARGLAAMAQAAMRLVGAAS
jgi:chaperonin cofactor prefoldin